MKLSIRLLFVAFSAVAIASPGRSADKPAARPDDGRRAALLKAGYTAVPLTYDAKSLSFFVDGAIGSEKVRVKILVDSGLDASMIDSKVAKALKLELGEEKTIYGIGGKSAGRLAFFSGIHLGTYDTSKDWDGLPAVVSDLSGWSGSPRAVIGMQVLEMWGAVIDYHYRTLYLRPPLLSTWPRLAGTWEAQSWQEEGAARKLDPKATPTFTFADQRLKITDGDKTREFDITIWPDLDEGDYLLLHRYDREKPEAPSAVGRIKMKDGKMTACMVLQGKKELEIPTEFAAPKGSGQVLLELKRTPVADRKKPADPLRELLVKDGYAAVPLEPQPDRSRLVAARTSKHDLRLCLDTGCSFSIFDMAGLKKWGVGAGEKVELQGLGVGFEGDIRILRDLRIGEYDAMRTWGGIECIGSDLTPLNKALVDSKRKPIDGLLGNLTLQNGSAVIDYHTNTLYLRPLKDTLWPKLQGKWKGVDQENDGVKGKYADAVAPTLEFKNGRMFYSSVKEKKEWGFHVQEYGPHYRVGLFDPKADGPLDDAGYESGFIFKLADSKLTMVMVIDTSKTKEEPTEFAAPKGSGLVMMEFERSK